MSLRAFCGESNFSPIEPFSPVANTSGAILPHAIIQAIVTMSAKDALLTGLSRSPLAFEIGFVPDQIFSFPPMADSLEVNKMSRSKRPRTSVFDTRKAVTSHMLCVCGGNKHEAHPFGAMAAFRRLQRNPLMTGFRARPQPNICGRTFAIERQNYHYG